MKSVSTFTASIYVGTREHDSGMIRSVDMAREYLRRYVNEYPLCVTIQETEFIYTQTKTVGGEPGFIVGIINYPRFPSTPEQIKEKTLSIAKGLLELFKQWKISVVFPDETVMLEAE